MDIPLKSMHGSDYEQSRVIFEILIITWLAWTLLSRTGGSLNKIDIKEGEQKTAQPGRGQMV